MSSDRAKHRKQGYDSDTSDDNKRKREESFEIFKSSKKTHRSPQKKQASTEMDDLKAMMHQLLSEVKEIRKEQQEFRQEYNELKKENIILNTRVAALENRITAMEKENRRNNIVIKGFKATEERQLHCEEVETFMESSLKTKVKLTSIREIKRNTGLPIIIAKCESFEQKLQIMKAKNRLKGTQFFIDDDLTSEERKVQSILRNMARDERGKGNSVKVGYRKLIINTEIWDWKEEESKVVRRQSKN